MTQPNASEPLREARDELVGKVTFLLDGPDTASLTLRGILTRYIDETFAALASQPEPLDAAWKAAEAALPEGWRLRVTRSDEDFDIWQASAVSPAFFDGENDNDAECAIGEAVVPAWALLALAARLPEEPR